MQGGRGAEVQDGSPGPQRKASCCYDCPSAGTRHSVPDRASGTHISARQWLPPRHSQEGPERETEACEGNGLLPAASSSPPGSSPRRGRGSDRPFHSSSRIHFVAFPPPRNYSSHTPRTPTPTSRQAPAFPAPSSKEPSSPLSPQGRLHGAGAGRGLLHDTCAPFSPFCFSIPG